ncbi:hypothetical protein K461DRAFT_110992 [Myriangium duriaei CBS 260.36]|uniref:Uncharacterized protein n=1 Tax=Myriangium duriaei CBS 260.36 TaxID=1168546 RepID=A0A9P4J4I5_9PEZI|nr:hypothetical protein K461DRAFT_110992 [Myriangium duriaei CBS 260.36]
MEWSRPRGIHASRSDSGSFNEQRQAMDAGGLVEAQNFEKLLAAVGLHSRSGVSWDNQGELKGRFSPHCHAQKHAGTSPTTSPLGANLRGNEGFLDSCQPSPGPVSERQRFC